MTGSGLATWCECDGREFELVWDTGANRSILKEGRVGKDEHGRFSARNFRLAGRDFGPQEFVILDLAEPPGDGLVGNDFFRKHRVLIDWGTSELSVE